MNIKDYILAEVAEHRLSVDEAKTYLTELAEVKSDSKQEDIAIIGMACEFSGADNREEFFDNIKNRVDGLTVFNQRRVDRLAPINENSLLRKFFFGIDIPMRQSEAKAAYFDDVEGFDANYFDMTEDEASYCDPIQRKFLLTVFEALEDAGYGGDKIRDTNTGVFVGRDHTTPTMYNYLVEDHPSLYGGTWAGILASRISYVLNLRGPAMVVDTACSSGLVSIHQAIQAIKGGECDMAIAGGIALGNTPQRADASGDQVLSSVNSSGETLRSFDKYSDGTIFGEGSGVVILKPLSAAIRDKDNIYALIKGSAINNDGASNGITTPNPDAQVEVYEKAWKNAGINPESLGYIEAHGTGTKLGDPIEVKSLTTAMSKYTDKKQFCGIGTIKTSIGHTVGASGLAGVIRVVYSMLSKTLYGNIHFTSPNPHIDFINSPFYLIDRPQKWDRNGDEPYRAAVSAFGFSGTNAHMILEEYIQDKRQTDPERQIFSLSAKTDTALYNTAKVLNDYIKDKDINFNDLCFTMNQGRGDYEYRLAIVAGSTEELIKKLDDFLSREKMASLPESNIYYARYKIVSDAKQKLEDYEIKYKDFYALENEAEEKLEKLIENPSDQDLQEDLAQMYAKGAGIDFASLYEDKDVKIISLPPYQFDKKSYWGKPKEAGSEKDGRRKVDYYYADERLFASPKIDVYKVTFSPARYWFIDEHSIFGKKMIPGAAYPDIFLSFAEHYMGKGAFVIENMIFYNPLITDEGEQEAFITVEKSDFALDIAIVSTENPEDEEPDWARHVEAKIKILNEEVPAALDLNAIRETMEERRYTIDFETEVIGFGNRWDNSKETYFDFENNITLGRHMLDEEVYSDFDNCKIHASLLDMALNWIPSLGNEENTHLPLILKEIKIFKPLCPEIYSYTVRTGKTDQTQSYDLIITNNQGEVLIVINGYTTKRVNRVRDVIGSDHKFYEVQWTELKGDLPRGNLLDGNLLIFADDKGYADALNEHYSKFGREIFIAQFGDVNEKLSDNRYQIDGSEESYADLLNQVRDKNVRYLIHLSSITDNPVIEDVAEQAKQLRRGSDSLFYLIKNMMTSKIHKNPMLICMTSYADYVTDEEEQIYPLNNMLSGLVKTVAMEYPNVSTRYIDLDDDADIIKALSIMLGSDEHKRLAVRKGRYYEELLNEYKTKDFSGNVFEVSEDGSYVRSVEDDDQEFKLIKDNTYLITGGTGGMGSVIGKHLAGQEKINLALLGSRAIDMEDEDDRRVVRINELKELGATVKYYACDVSDEKSLAGALDRIREDFGPINGIFHCAGVAGDGYLMNKDYATYAEVLAPKVTGSYLLYQLTKGDPLDIFYMASTMSTLISAPGSGDYVAANAYLDSFAAKLQKENILAISLNWPGWSETGMAADRNLDVSYGLFEPVDNESAMSILDEAITKHMYHAYPGQLNLQVATNVNLKSYIKISGKLENELERTAHMMLGQPQDISRINIDEIELDGKVDSDYTETEIIVGKVIASVLGLQRIDIYENISDIGADSMVITQISQVLGEQFERGIVDMADIFMHNTVYELSAYIDERQSKKDEDDSEIMAAQLLAGQIDVEDIELDEADDKTQGE